MSARALGARATLRPLDAPWIDPPLLLEVAQVVRLVGESLRGRLLTVEGVGGAELCLRPDMTIPTALHYAGGQLAGKPAAYRYDGPIFRAPGSGEASEAQIAVLGVERFAEADRAGVDVELLAGALEVCAAGGLKETEVILTDLSVFDVFLEALAVEQPWSGRLAAAARRPAALEKLLDGEDALPPGDPALNLAQLTPEAARVQAAALTAAPRGPLVGRSPEAIAARLTDKAALARNPAPPPEASGVLRALLRNAGEPRGVLERRAALAKKYGLQIDAYLDHAAHRLDAMDAALPKGCALRADPRAQGAFWYYDGFMFSVRDKAGRQAAAGGRYDGLLARMTGGRIDAPAAGFTVYPAALEARP